MKIGLALSGGGFRATLYHLGLIRFLRDANILPHVTHITAVSGGSIIAAHLGLNWQRYTGSPEDFDEAASELLHFVRVDIRNRILRRYGLGIFMRGPRRLVGLSNRGVTRTGLLEHKYRKYLFGETSLFQLPEYPGVHLLATNLSEGRLCSFHRGGMLVIRPGSEGAFEVDRNAAGLTRVSMAVAASSAFPGFFPPFVLTGEDVGANKAEFGRQAFTDGGVFDNLGVRMFRCLEETLGEEGFPWDKVLVSDVGRQFEILSNASNAGLIRTAMRASDILMNRVWHLENDAVRDSTGFVFARVTDIVDPKQDSSAPHPEIQRHLPSIRTDFDRFSSIEISNLIRHGYCVARKACRSMPDVFGTSLPDNPPWDPVGDSRVAAAAATDAPAGKRDRPNASSVAHDARALHASSARRLWSTALDFRDWVSWVYVPIIVPILVLLPYFMVQYHKESQRAHQIMRSLAQGSRDLEQMTMLLQGPVAPWKGGEAEDLPVDSHVDLTNFIILQDSRIIDLRNWRPPASARPSPNSTVYGYRRLKVVKRSDAGSSDQFRVSVLALHPDTQVRFPPQQLTPKLYSRPQSVSPDGNSLRHFEVGADFSKVPNGEFVDLIYEHLSPGLFLRSGVKSTTMPFEVEAETVELTRWLLLPEGSEYESFELIRYETANPEAPEKVQIITRYLADDYTILAFKLLSLKGGYTYELTWHYR